MPVFACPVCSWSLKNLGISCSIVYLMKLYVACATKSAHVAGAADDTTISPNQTDEANLANLAMTIHCMVRKKHGKCDVFTSSDSKKMVRVYMKTALGLHSVALAAPAVLANWSCLP